jgi:serine/threonine protein kinase
MQLEEITYPYKIGGGITSIVDRISDDVVRKQITMKDISSDFLFVEMDRLNLLNRICPKHFPKVIDYSTSSMYIDIEYAGIELYSSDIPPDYREQISNIAEHLSRCSIFHNDITSRNILVRDGIIKMIDFADCKVSAQGVRPIQDVWIKGKKFEQGNHYPCLWISDTVDKVDFILSDDKNEYTALSCHMAAIRSRSWVSQRSQIMGLFNNVLSHREKNASQ